MAYIVDPAGEKATTQPKTANNRPNVPQQTTASRIPLNMTGPTLFDYRAGKMSEEQLGVYQGGRPNTSTTPQNYKEKVNENDTVKTTFPVFDAHMQSDDPRDQAEFPRSFQQFAAPPSQSPLLPGYKLNFPYPAIDLGSKDPNKGWSQGRP